MSYKTLLLRFTHRWCLLLLSLFSLTSCLDLAYDQNLESVFSTQEQIPQKLFQKANQINQIKNIDKTLINQRQGLRVAVIDNGFDLTHPDLVESYDFQFDHRGNIIGVGRDVMGNDNFPSSNIINYDLFAFSGEGVIDGTIQFNSIDPLTLLVKINDEFIIKMQNKINTDSSFEGTLFSQLDLNKHLTFASAYFMYINDYWDFDYSEEISKRERADLTTLNRMKNDPIFLNKTSKKDHNLVLLGLLESFQKDYEIFDLEGGFSDLLDSGSIRYIRGRNAFKKIAFETLQDLEAKYDLKRRFSQLIQFYKDRGVLEKDETDYGIWEKVRNSLNQSLLLEKFGYRLLLPSFKVSANQKKVYESYHSDQGQLQESHFSASNRSFKYIEGLLEDSLQNSQKLNLTDEKQQEITRLQKGLKQFKKLLQWQKDNGYSFNQTLDKKINHPNRYQEFLRQLKHPYIFADSQGTIHGTHVSGIVSQQHKENRIYPIRVSLRNLNFNQQRIQRLENNFRDGLEQWIALPPIFQGLKKILANFIDKDLSHDSQEVREQFSKDLLSLLDENIALNVRKNPHNFNSFSDIKNAIHHVGKKKIKIANLSLGGTFDNVVNVTDVSGKKLNKKILFQFLMAEYFKYMVSQAITEKAPHTLFVVALGNESKWIDGRSRNALPVDLRSPYFQRFETKTTKLPNNHLTNILAVGSLAEKNKLSSFTNLLIGKELPPFILAFGENILSPVRSYDQSAVNHLVKSRLPYISGLFDNNLGQFHKLNKEYKLNVPLTTSLLTEEQEKDKEDVIYTTRNSMFIDKRTYLNSLWSNLLFELSISFPIKRAYLSGTSMATPVVSGFLAGKAYDKMKKLNLTIDDIYNHPEFSPKILIDQLMNEYGEKKGWIPFHRLIKIVKYNKDRANLDLENFIKMIQIETEKGVHHEL